jgi:phosphonate transport system substrate-binding protein
MYEVYDFIAGYIGEELGIQTELVVGETFDQFASGEIVAGFICGLPYVNLADQNPSQVSLLAAPVLSSERYEARPIYFSDVIVRRDSPFRAFEDLRGCSWSFNDPDSQSGYGITRYTLAKMGESRGFFGEVMRAGFHQESIQWVASGRVDASAIDSQVLAVELRDHPELAGQIKVIDSLGPSSIQPFVAASWLPEELKIGIRTALLEIGADPDARSRLGKGFIERFAPVEDADYDDIRQMAAFVASSGMDAWD